MCSKALNKIKGLKELFRWKPVLAWTVSGVLLGLGTAIYESGFNLNYFYLLLSFVVVIIIQAFLAHAVNDLVDEEVDKNAKIRETGRVKVLIEGIMNRKDLMLVSFVSLLFIVGVMIYLTYNLGYFIPILVSVGVYAALGYSLPPLKLGWRPFSELTIVLPALTTLVVGVNFVLTGNLSLLAFLVGLVFAFANIVWFMLSRAQDAPIDEIMGKNTTIVLFGLKNLDLLLCVYCTWFVLLSLLPWLLYGLIWFSMLVCIAGIGYVLIANRVRVWNVKTIAQARIRSIYLVFVWSVFTTIVFIIEGVFSYSVL